MIRRLTLMTAAAAFAFAANLFAQEAPAPAPRDTIRRVDGKIMANLTVLGETPTEVKIDIDGDGKATKPEETVDQNDVRSIDYGGAPSSYVQALAYYRVRQYDKAIESLKEAVADPQARKWVKDYAAYYTAMSMEKQAETNPAERPKAVAAFEALLKNSQNRWRDEAKYRLGEMHLAAGDTAKAQETFGALEKEAYREETKLNAASGVAALLMASGKPDEALKRYDTIIAGAKVRYADLYVSSLVGKAQALTALKQYADAVTFLDGVVKSSTNEEVLAKARSALGDCFFAQAQGSKDEAEQRSLYKSALKNYLWNVVVFFNQKGECARSLLWAGRCWEKLGDSARAQELYGRLRSEFGSTPWAGMIGK